MAQDIQPLDTATARIHQLESAVHRLSVENARLKNILSFEAATMAGELLDAEESLNQSNRDLRSILNSMPAMIGYWDKNLCNRFGNTAYVEWFGDAGTSIAGKHIREVIGEERYQLNLPYIEAALLGERQEFERAIPSPDGKQVRYSLAQYLPDIVDGEVQGFYALVNDVSAIKHTEATLRERDEKLRGLYELSPLGIAMADMSGRFIDFNEAFRNICGYSTEELKELDYWALTPQRYAADEAVHLEQIKRAGHFGPYEKEYLRKDGCLIPVAMNGVLITGSDGQPYIWCIVEDLTKRKHAEQLKRVLDEYHELSLDVLDQKREKIVGALTTLSLYRDNETGLHLNRVKLYVEALAKELRRAGCYTDQLTDRQIDIIVKAAPMHDLGKVGIPDSILLKPGRHTSEETVVMRTHAQIGESILAAVAGHEDTSNSLLVVAALIAGSHHEKWDGSGYPRGIKGQAIPLAGRLMALADVYDALTTPRVYKRAWTHEAATVEILGLKGTSFDPAIVDAFQQVEARFRDIALELGDSVTHAPHDL